MGRGAGRGEALARVLSSFPGQVKPPRPTLAAEALPGIPNSPPATTAIPRPWVHMPSQLRPVTHNAATTPVVVCFPSPMTTPPTPITVVSPTPMAPSTTDDGVVTSIVNLTGEASAFAEGASGPSPSVVRGLDDQQKCLLTFTRPWWLQGRLASHPRSAHCSEITAWTIRLPG